MSGNKTVECRGHFQCERKPFRDGLCEFHLPTDHREALPSDAYNQLLIEEIKEAVQNDEGIFVFHWESFHFPRNHVLFDFGIFTEVEERIAKGWFNLKGSNIQSIRIGVNKIHKLLLSDAIVHGETMIPVMEIDRINISRTNFLEKFNCASKTPEYEAVGAVFDGEFSFGSVISKYAKFTGCRFNQPCIFHGELASVLEVSDTDKFRFIAFDGSIFGNPTQTIFQDFDLRKASFKSVSLVGVRFYNTNFFQTKLNRNGLDRDVQELQRNEKAPLFSLFNKKVDNNSIKRDAHLEHEYRQLRMAMEASKDYGKAHDFYVGEMEARQRRERSILLTVYCFSSYYGINYWRAFVVLIGFFISHFLLTIFLSTNLEAQKLFYGPDTAAAWGRLGDIVTHTLGTGTLQRIGLLDTTSFWQKLVDLTFRLIIPIQAAMFILALRNKTKRG